LTKIIDGDGEPIEPQFSEFVEYMGDTRIVFNSGLKDQALNESLEAEDFTKASFRLKELYCTETETDVLGICGSPKIVNQREVEEMLVM